jgi:branched-chain amino acid transport system permease protein
VKPSLLDRGGLRAAVDVGVPVALLLGAVYLLTTAVGSGAWTRVGIALFINVVVVVGLYAFIGNSGVLSFGQVGFMAVGAYTNALVTIPPATKKIFLPELPAWLAEMHLGTFQGILVAAAAAGFAALLVGIPLMRLSGLGAAIATLAVIQIVFIVARNWEPVTRGTASMLGVPTDTTLTSTFLYACVAILVAAGFQGSRVGLRLRSSREDEYAAAALGVNVTRVRLAGFVLSGALTGVAGALTGHFLGVFSPDSFYLSLTFLTLAMLVVGGMYSLTGAIVGTVAVTAVSEALVRVENSGQLTGLREIGIAILMLAVLVWRPRGLTGSGELRLSTLCRTVRRGRRPPPAPAATSSTGEHHAQ